MVSSESITFLALFVPCHHCMYNLLWTVTSTCYLTSSEGLKGQNHSSLLLWPCEYLWGDQGPTISDFFFFYWIEKCFKRKPTCATEFYEPAHALATEADSVAASATRKPSSASICCHLPALVQPQLRALAVPVTLAGLQPADPTPHPLLAGIWLSFAVRNKYWKRQSNIRWELNLLPI